MWRYVVPTAALWVLAAQAAWADELLLKSGGRVRGTWVNFDQQPRTDYQFRTEQGGLLTIDASQVAVARRQSSAERTYEARMPEYADTADDQWQLAQWCREHGLTRQSAVHLQRVLELDPGDARAWRALGYSQIAGRWTTRRQFLREQGYVLHEGEWRVAQEVELLERRKQTKALEGEWYANLRRWRSRVLSNKPQDAWARMAAIRDPLAIRALASFLAKEPHRGLKLLYVEVLGEIDDPRAVAALVATAMNDPDIEVFHAAADALVARKSPQLVKLFAGALKEPNNLRVNRAAYILARLDDRSVIQPLIDALITAHVQHLPASQMLTVGFEHQLAGIDSAGMASRAGAGGQAFIGGARAAQAVPYSTANPAVLDALVKLSGGVSFGYNQAAWRRWADVNRASGTSTQLQARRD